MESDLKYKILNDKKLGRYLVANQPLQKGSLIFNDVPFAIGPKQDSPPVCLGCHGFWKKSYYCSKCGWPCCNQSCENNSIHREYECDVFVKSQAKFQHVSDSTKPCLQFDCITPLRMLLSKEKNPVRWEKEVAVMEDHETERRQKPTWDVDNVNIVGYLREPCKLRDRFPEEIIQKVCGILEVNSVEIPSYGGPNIRGIYPNLAIMSHSCVPTVVHTIISGGEEGIPQNLEGINKFDANPNCTFCCEDNLSATSCILCYSKSTEAQIWAAHDISKGDKLELCYTHVLYCTLQRRYHLKQSKFFDCDCKRCADPTELNTNMSSLKCNGCENGIILPVDPLDAESTWNCSNCKYYTTSDVVHRVVNTIQKEIDRLEESIYGEVDDREEELKWYQNILHPKHSILLGLKYTLSQAYGQVKGYRIEELTVSKLKYKIDMCNELLQILNIISPGQTRMRGVLLYELYGSLLKLDKMELKLGNITMDQFSSRTEEVLKILKESSEILVREDKKSSKGALGLLAIEKYNALSLSLQ
ncbi:SET and MYND domain containing, arthropod-specific, member 3 [Arctopsyche grandis]|uniref:SET and MYND domain containing, arthropod-specific, member 3 n=1 Tax=Arctopsyche grandis TaxID=121162 RepID=UPI00406D6376